jgi:hypothetical protein
MVIPWHVSFVLIVATSEQIARERSSTSIRRLAARRAHQLHEFGELVVGQISEVLLDS